MWRTVASSLNAELLVIHNNSTLGGDDVVRGDPRADDDDEQCSLASTDASSSSHDSIIGKRFLFELLFSAGDVGEFILTFLPGKKGKEWSCVGLLRINGVGPKF